MAGENQGRISMPKTQFQKRSPLGQPDDPLRVPIQDEAVVECVCKIILISGNRIVQAGHAIHVFGMISGLGTGHYLAPGWLTTILKNSHSQVKVSSRVDMLTVWTWKISGALDDESRPLLHVLQDSPDI